MDTSLERIRAKIAELDAKIIDLRITERELVALEKRPAQPTKAAPKRGRKPKTEPVSSVPAEKPQTVGAAISDVLAQHDALSVAEIAGYIAATGREIDNRSVSFTLQALKKRGFVKNSDGRWTASKARSK
jgi:hypothetical protein